MTKTAALINLDDAKRFWLFLTTATGQVREVRAPDTQWGTCNANCDTPDAFLAAIKELNGRAPLIYVTLNDLNPELAGRNRAYNHIKRYAKATTSDNDITKRTAILIDFDSGTPSGINSTDEEQAAALALADRVESFLIRHDIPRDAVLSTSSGNGAGLIIGIDDTPNTPETANVISHFLQALDMLFGQGDGKPHIDVKVYNAARITKVPGTFVQKGDPTPGRPQRLSAIRHGPLHRVNANFSAVRTIAAMLPKEPPALPRAYQSDGHVDLREWLTKYNVPILREKPWNGATLFEIPCQWNESHAGGEAWAAQWPNGAVEAGCPHAHCAGKHWHDLRNIYEPEFEKRTETLRAAPVETIPDELIDMLDDEGDAPRETFLDALHRTDTGNALRLLSTHGQDMKYCRLQKAWYTWNGRYWERGVDRVYDFAKQVPRLILIEAAKEQDDDQRKALVEWAMKSESMPRIDAMIKWAESDERVRIKPEQFDGDVWLLNCSNVTIDLRDGATKTPDRADLITRCVPLDYDPHADQKAWLAFLERIMPNPDSRRTLMVALGYSATGSQREKAYFLALGPSDAAKSTLLKVVRRVLGPYADGADAELFMVRTRESGSGPNEGVANLRGKRFVVSTEIEQHRTLASAYLKGITGGESLKSNRKYESEFDFFPGCKIWLNGNHEPRVTDPDDSIWNRMHRFTFPHPIPKSEQIKDYDLSLYQQNGPGILAYLVQGAVICYEQGITDSQEIQEAKASYRHEQDTVAAFIEDWCVNHTSHSITLLVLYKAYEKWADTNNAYALGKIDFRKAVELKGYKYGPGNGNKPTFQGIALKTLI